VLLSLSVSKAVLDGSLESPPAVFDTSGFVILRYYWFPLIMLNMQYMFPFQEGYRRNSS